MATRKRNEYLDVEESQDEESDYDSEAAQNNKVGRASKKRKLVDLHQDAFQNKSEEDSEEDFGHQPKLSDRNTAPGKSDMLNGVLESNRDENGVQSEDDDEMQQQRISKPSAASRKPKKKNKTGVIYLSRIPPFMKPATVRHFLSPYGEISRLFLTPESPTSHSARVRHGGNKKRSFVDGWVEFVHKSDAKLVAETLNANIIGGKKGGYYHDDVWNIKYLRGFKWADLTEQIKNENAERAARLRMEIAQTTKENKRFVEGVDKAKMLEKMEGKRKAREADNQPPIPGNNQHRSHRLDSTRDRKYAPDRRQNASEKNHTESKTDKESSTNVKQVLDMIM